MDPIIDFYLWLLWGVFTIFLFAIGAILFQVFFG